MAPEQFTDASRVDARTDIYAVGLILHELLSGTARFDGDSLYSVMNAVVGGGGSPLPPTVPEALQEAVEQASAVDPEDRFASCTAFRAALASGASEPKAAAKEPEHLELDAPKPTVQMPPPLASLAVLQKWAFKTEGPVCSPAFSDGVVYVGSDDKNLYAVDANTGREIWAFKTGGRVWSSAGSRTAAASEGCSAPSGSSVCLTA